MYGPSIISVLGCQGQLVTMAARAIIYISAICWCKKLNFGGGILVWPKSHFCFWLPGITSSHGNKDDHLHLSFYGLQSSNQDNKRNHYISVTWWHIKLTFGRWVLPWPDDHFYCWLLGTISFRGNKK